MEHPPVHCRYFLVFWLTNYSFIHLSLSRIYAVRFTIVSCEHDEMRRIPTSPVRSERFWRSTEIFSLSCSEPFCSRHRFANTTVPARSHFLIISPFCRKMFIFILKNTFFKPNKIAFWRFSTHERLLLLFLGKFESLSSFTLDTIQLDLTSSRRCSACDSCDATSSTARRHSEGPGGEITVNDRDWNSR